MESHFTVTIVGLGVIGGSMAYALRGFKDCRILGVDIKPQVLEAAVERRAIDDGYIDAKTALQQSDLVILAIYPDYMSPFIKENAAYFKDGAVVTDVCGVKSAIVYEIERELPENVDFVGGHPMAGREVDGFFNADKNLFQKTGFIITPTKRSRQSGIELVTEMARYMGADKIAYATPEKHDEIIAYTSDLMHVAASALCLDFHPDMSMAYTAGAFRDCTRIANICPELWSELFLKNRENTVNEISKFIAGLEEIKKAIANDDRDSLFNILDRVRKNKEEMQKR